MSAKTQHNMYLCTVCITTTCFGLFFRPSSGCSHKYGHWKDVWDLII